MADVVKGHRQNQRQARGLLPTPSVSRLKREPRSLLCMSCFVHPHHTQEGQCGDGHISSLREEGLFVCLLFFFLAPRTISLVLLEGDTLGKQSNKDPAANLPSLPLNLGWTLLTGKNVAFC